MKHQKYTKPILPVKTLLIAGSALAVLVIGSILLFGDDSNKRFASLSNNTVQPSAQLTIPAGLQTELPTETVIPTDNVTGTASLVTASPDTTQTGTAVVTATKAATAKASISPSVQTTKATAKPSIVTQAAVSYPVDKWVKTYEVKATTYYNKVGFSSNHYTYTAEELKILATMIYLEARGESYKGKLAVANVAMNRVLAKNYPGNTIKEVVTAPNQFAYNAATQPDSSCMRAARDVLEAEYWVIPQNVYYFKMSSDESDWGGHSYSTTIGVHGFYEESVSGRYQGNAIPAKKFSRVYQWPQFGCVPATRVVRIQKMLKALGYTVKADGYFGTDTEKALKAFQKSVKMKQDGVAGPKTIKALIKKYGNAKYAKNFT